MKKVILTLLAVASLASAANAQTVVDIGGSTAGRSGVHTAILAILSNCTYAYDGTSSAAAATRVIYNGVYNSTNYTIRTLWLGSKNGIEDVVNGTQQSGLWVKSTTGTSGGQISTNATTAPASAETAFEIGFSDTFASTFGLTATTNNLKVGVLPFRWFCNNGTTGIDNLTSATARRLYQSNNTRKSVLTGLASDNSTLVYSLGRDADSGSRAVAMAEVGRGNVATPSIRSVTINSTTNTITATLGTTSGYTSGSSVKNALNATFGSGALVGYVGPSDVPAGGVLLKWNGVAYSDDAVKNGSYTFWSYLHMNYQTLGTAEKAFADALETQLLLNPGSGVLKETDMTVARTTDAGVLSLK